MALRDDEVDDVIEAIATHYADRLSTWENGFMDSVSRARDDGRALTDTQKAKLDEIFERVSNGGRG